MKLDQDLVCWIEKHRKLIADLRKAENLVDYGKIILFYQNGKYLGMDACPRIRFN